MRYSFRPALAHYPYSRFSDYKRSRFHTWGLDIYAYGTRLLEETVMHKIYKKKGEPARGSTTTVTGQNMICPDLERPPPASAGLYTQI